MTDAISALGLQDGTHHVGELAIEIRDQKAYISGTNTLCGSIANMTECVKHFKSATGMICIKMICTLLSIILICQIVFLLLCVFFLSGCSIVEALEAATLHPAQVLKLDHQIGTLCFGADADFIMLNPENLSLLSTWISGDCVYKSEG